MQVNEAAGVKVEPSAELQTVGDLLAKIQELQGC